MGHQHHDHNHAHGHCNHGPANYNKAFLIGIVLNTFFVATEATYGYLSHSLALFADAGHNLSDVLGLVLAWLATWLATHKPTKQFTYGLKSSTILAALSNAALLLLVAGGLIWESVMRLQTPSTVDSNTVIWVAAAGILINGITALLFLSGRKSDLNIKGAYLHMASDALISFGVVIAGVIIHYTGWSLLDPIISLAINMVIILGTWNLLKDSLKLAIAAVPSSINPQNVFDYLKNLRGVKSVHDLHIWGMSTTETALTAHLVIPGEYPGDAFFKSISNELNKRFKIQHPTIQIERGDDGHVCHLEPDEVV